MHNKLLIKAFEKAEKEIESEKVFPRAQQLSDYIFEDSKEQYGEKSLRIKYTAISEDSKKTIRLKKHVEEALSHYLGYEDYAGFVRAHNDAKVEEDHKPRLFSTKNKIILTIVLLIIASVVLYNSATKQRWMVWQDDQYIEVDFDVKRYKVDQIKLYKEERIERFKKITTDSSTLFFNKDGSVKIWYGKNHKKELEYFTALGLHPETGKTLKPITAYMIKTHIYNK
jgi:hypothetical protein